MDKQHVISMLRNAVRGHKRWTENASSLIEGASLEKDQVPVNSTDCEFGKWYYSDGQDLRELPGFAEIEGLHDMLHKTYREIFNLLFGEPEKKTSFFGRLFGRAHKASAANKELAMEKYHRLNEQSKQIVNQLVQLEKVIAAMSEDQLDNYQKQGSM